LDVCPARALAAVFTLRTPVFRCSPLKIGRSRTGNLFRAIREFKSAEQGTWGRFLAFDGSVRSRLDPTAARDLLTNLGVPPSVSALTLFAVRGTPPSAPKQAGLESSRTRNLLDPHGDLSMGSIAFGYRGRSRYPAPGCECAPSRLARFK
jgi:hypothetical protein